MIGSMLKFELKYHFGQSIFIVTALLFFALGTFSALMGGFGGPEVHKNAPYVITNIIALFSLLTIFAATLFCANVVLRDTIYKMESVVFTTAVKKKPYFFVRFMGLLIAVFSLLVCTVLGIYIGCMFQPASNIGVFKWSYFIQPLFVFGLPNVLFVVSLILGTALLTKNVRAIYATGVLLYILYMLASILGNSPMIATSAFRVNEPGLLPFLIDPFGLASFFSETKAWSDVQRNQLLFPVNGAFLLNRMLWLMVSTIAIALSYHFFNFRIQQQKQSKLKNSTIKPLKVIPFKHFAVFPNGFKYNFSVFKSQFKIELSSLFKHIPLMVMLLLWTFIYGIELKDTLFHGPYGVRAYPTTGFIIEEMRAIKFALLLIIFYAAEVIAREKAVNIQGLVFSTPVRNEVLWMAKSLTLCILVLVLVSINILIGIVLQLSSGYFNFDLLHYFSLYYYSAFPLFLFVVLIVFVQNLVANKYLGMLLSMIVVFAFSFSTKFGIEHYLLRFATVPDLQFSYFNGFGHYAKAFNWYMLYWFGFAILLAILTIAMWQTSIQNTFLDRLKAIPKTMYKARFVVLCALLIWISCGAFIYQQTNVIGNYKNKKTQLAWRISYEKKYKKFAELPQPIIKAVKTQVDLLTTTNSYEVKGSYHIKNESNSPITKIWIGLNQAVNHFEIQIANAKAQEIDKEFNQQFIELNTPLQPGAEIDMGFKFAVIRSGFVPFDSENSVAKDGSYIELEKFVPQFGYDPGLEISDERTRLEAGLSPMKVELSSDLNYHLIDFETTISTALGQQVVTVGTLQKTWTANNRSYFNYKTETPIRFMLALSSANYELKKANYMGLTFSIYYKKGQEYNLNNILKAAKDAVAYGSTNFGPYPFKQLTIAEIPQYKGAATAYPGVVFNAERLNYLNNYTDPEQIDQSYAITAHEVAHQWWANRITPVFGPGDALLTESLAKYTENVLLAQNFGKMYLSKYLKMDNNLYFVYRNPNEKEFPLAQTYEQNHVHYQKGGLNMYAAKEALGEKAVNNVLKQLIEQHSSPHQKAKAADLINALIEVAPAAQKGFIELSFNKVATYQLQLKVLSCKPMANGKFRLAIQANISQHQDGIEKALPPNMDVDVAVFKTQQVAWNRHTLPIYLKKHRFNKLENRLTLIVDAPPKSVAIDPYGYLLNEAPGDNIQDIK